MSLFDQIIAIYPELTENDFVPDRGTIHLKDDGDGKGPFIAKWDHPTLAKPTEDQLK